MSTRRLVWLGGTFGAGKTTTGRLLVERAPGLRLFDPEWVGFLLRESKRLLAQEKSDENRDALLETREWQIEEEDQEEDVICVDNLVLVFFKKSIPAVRKAIELRVKKKDL